MKVKHRYLKRISSEYVFYQSDILDALCNKFDIDRSEIDACSLDWGDGEDVSLRLVTNYDKPLDIANGEHLGCLENDKR